MYIGIQVYRYIGIDVCKYICIYVYIYIYVCVCVQCIDVYTLRKRIKRSCVVMTQDSILPHMSMRGFGYALECLTLRPKP